MPASKETDRIYLREEERSILQSMLDEWAIKPDKKTRDAYVSSTAVPKIQDLNLKEFGPDIISKNKVAKVQWEKRVAAIYTWFKNHKPFKDRQVFKIERKIPLRRVVGKLRAAEIDLIISRNHPNLQKGEKAYPGVYQKAVTDLMALMSEEELSDMKGILEEWQAEGPPIDVRLKAAKKYGRRAIVNAHQLLQKEMYISCITISMVPDVETGTMGVTCHDYIAASHALTHGKKVLSFQEWSGSKYQSFMEHMISYANYLKDAKSEEAEPCEKAVPIMFEAGEGDLPLLPAPMIGVRTGEVAKFAKDVIRAYFLRHYQLATGCESARTPWAQIGEDPARFFDPACLPEGFKFQDPSRMGVQVKALLNHLRQRQEELGVRAFRFHNVLWNNELAPAQYPLAALAVLDPKPSAPEPIQPKAEAAEAAEGASPTKRKEKKPKGNRKGKSPVKPKGPAKEKSPAKPKSPTKSNGQTPVKLEQAIKFEEAIKLEGSLTPSDPAPALGVEAQAHIVPAEVPDVDPLQHPQNTLSRDITAQLDPLIMAESQPNIHIPIAQPNVAAIHPGWTQNPSYTGMPSLPPPFNLAMLNDPHYGMMFHHLMSQLGGRPGWGPPMFSPGGQEPLHASPTSAPTSFPLPSFPPPSFSPASFAPALFAPPPFPATPPPPPPVNASGYSFAATPQHALHPAHLPSSVIEQYPIPAGDPPFVSLQQFPSMVPALQQQHREATPVPGINSAVWTPGKQPSGKRKRDDKDETPSKTPIRSSNRMKTPRKPFT